jgi:hypothetical protein
MAAPSVNMEYTDILLHIESQDAMPYSSIAASLVTVFQFRPVPSHGSLNLERPAPLG